MFAVFFFVFFLQFYDMFCISLYLLFIVNEFVLNNTLITGHLVETSSKTLPVITKLLFSYIPELRSEISSVSIRRLLSPSLVICSKIMAFKGLMPMIFEFSKCGKISKQKSDMPYPVGRIVNVSLRIAEAISFIRRGLMKE